MSFADRIGAMAQGLPGAEFSTPFEHDHEAWKVGGKMFTCRGSMTPGVSVKTPNVETARMLIEAGVGVKAPYFHASWIHLPESVAEDELRHRIRVSYDTVRLGLTKKLQKTLPDWEGV